LVEAIVSRMTVGAPRSVAAHNTDSKFITLNVRNGPFSHMEIEEAVIVGLLAVGMSLLAVMTIMIFW